MTFYRIVIGDSRDMSLVESSSVDFVVTSPPYWNVISFNHPKDIGSIVDRSKFFEELGKVWSECYRVLKPGGHLAVNFADSYMLSGKIECIVPDMLKSMPKEFVLQNRLIWRKYESGAGIVRFPLVDYKNVASGAVEPMNLMNWEYVFVWKKPGRRDWKFELSRSEWVEYCDGVWYIDASAEAGASEVIPGGAVFPVELPKRLIRTYTQKGDVVLDPFGGTGTTMLAAFQTRRSCWLYEVRAEMLPIIKKKVLYGQRRFGETDEWRTYT